MKKISHPAKEAARRIRSAKRVVITTHIDPDGDAVGSVLGLGLALRQAGVKTTLWPYSAPARYGELPSFGETETPPRLGAGDVVVALDAANLERLPAEIGAFSKEGGVLVNIDHHASNDRFGSTVWVDPRAPAAAYMVWELLKSLGVAPSPDAALCLYVGLYTDTGGFTYSNATPEAFRAAADMIARGADTSRANRILNAGFSAAYLHGLGAALCRLRIEAAGALVYTFISAVEFGAIYDAGGEPEGIVDYTRRVAGCVVGVLFIDQGDGKIRVSFRTVPGRDVAVLAAAHGGGGHAAAAGCVVAGELDEVIKRVVREVTVWLNSPPAA